MLLASYCIFQNLLLTLLGDDVRSNLWQVKFDTSWLEIIFLKLHEYLRVVFARFRNRSLLVDHLDFVAALNEFAVPRFLHQIRVSLHLRCKWAVTSYTLVSFHLLLLELYVFPNDIFVYHCTSGNLGFANPLRGCLFASDSLMAQLFQRTFRLVQT